jgi:hypothetical protein
VKPVMDWVKGNVLIVVFCALILLMLPTAWYFSSAWDAKIRAKQAKDATDAFNKLQSLKINYTLPVIEASGQPITQNEVPNLNLINWFKEQREVMLQQAEAVVAKAEAFNKGVGPDAQSVGRTEHVLLVEGAFPAGGQSMLDRMEDALLGNRGAANPYQALLSSARAGAPADPAQLADSLAAFIASEKEKITANKRDTTAEEQEKLVKQVTERRLGEYQGRAQALSVYASMESFPSDPRSAFVPSGSNLDPRFINPSDMFLFQWDYWVLRDIFAAVNLANTVNGRLANVDQATVKRIEKIDITLPANVVRSGASREASAMENYRGPHGGVDPATGMPMEAPAAAPTAPGMAALDFDSSITGRRASNDIYDTRVVTLTCVVSSARLQDFLAAIERTNFMTVTDMDLQEVKVWDDLQRGYWYGPEHVVRATLEIETVWLRSWTTKFMPQDLKGTLKVPDPAADPNAIPDPAADPNAQPTGGMG